MRAAVTLSELLTTGVLLRRNRYQLLTTNSRGGIDDADIGNNNIEGNNTATGSRPRAGSIASSVSAQLQHEHQEMEAMLHTSALDALREFVEVARKTHHSAAFAATTSATRANEPHFAMLVGGSPR